MPLPVPPTEKQWEFGEPLGRHTVVALPFPETILIARHIAAPEIHTYLSAVAVADIRDPRTPAPMPSDESGRSAQRFVVEVVARRATAVRAATAGGRDIYAFTAPSSARRPSGSSRVACVAPEPIRRARSSRRRTFSGRFRPSISGSKCAPSPERTSARAGGGAGR